MSSRIDVEGDDEVAQLAHTFNGMHDRLAIAFSSQREFIRDVSHELRTPIAVSRGHLELLAGGHQSGRRGAPGDDRACHGRARPDEPVRLRPPPAPES